MSWIPFWPDTASNTAVTVNTLAIGLFAVSAFICLVVYALILLFAFRYRRGGSADRSHRVKKSWHWEIGWTSATLIAFLVLFVWGAGAYLWLYQPPANAGDEIYVVGKQWMWKVEHPGGQREIDALHVPLGRPIRLVLTSQDVIHSFFIPDFRIKHDVLPGQYETMWFTATKKGEFRIECTQFCGTQHAEMGGWVTVMDPADYQRWLNDQGAEPDLARQGEALFRQLGCSGCHGANSTVHAPSLAGIYGKPVQLEGGRSEIVDDRYIHDCIMLPRTERVAGYPPIMPTFAGQIGEEDVLKLVAYIKSLGNPASAAR
ncbi:MAG TPA: cytochrome c oxidase subunit II [Stellaceae bacterium]|nr:cytochrome c oxidase subunit II [Stellaceae bacterium]